jgi:hypothetical protein
MSRFYSACIPCLLQSSAPAAASPGVTPWKGLVRNKREALAKPIFQPSLAHFFRRITGECSLVWRILCCQLSFALKITVFGHSSSVPACKSGVFAAF